MVQLSGRHGSLRQYRGGDFGQVSAESPAVRRSHPCCCRCAARECLYAIAGLDPDRIKVEFTQHSGDEMYHPHLGGFNADWQPRD
jgi:hypothetical protein